MFVFRFDDSKDLLWGFGSNATDFHQVGYHLASYGEKSKEWRIYDLGMDTCISINNPEDNWSQISTLMTYEGELVWALSVLCQPDAQIENRLLLISLDSHEVLHKPLILNDFDDARMHGPFGIASERRI